MFQAVATLIIWVFSAKFKHINLIMQTASVPSNDL